MGSNDANPRIAWMIALGVLAGVLGGLFGIGGGLVVVPALVLLHGLDQKTATGTALFALVWPVGLLAVLEYWSRSEVRLDWGGMVSLGLVGGVLIGARLTAPPTPSTMKRLYGVFLLLVGAYFFLSTNPGTPESTPVVTSEGSLWLGLGVGLVAGVLGGLFGIGGGLVIVPALKLIAGLDQKTATGTSLFAQVWPVGLLGVLEYRNRGESRADLGAGIAGGLLLGNLLGARLTRPLSPESLQGIYGGFCLLVGLYYLRTRPRTLAAPTKASTAGEEPGQPSNPPPE